MDAEFYEEGGRVTLHIEAKSDPALVEAIAEQIDAIGEVGALPPHIAKEIEYVLDLDPRYLWLVGPGTVEPARHLFAVEVDRLNATMERIASLPKR